jgi:hypothetical protein
VVTFALTLFMVVATVIAAQTRASSTPGASSSTPRDGGFLLWLRYVLDFFLGLERHACDDGAILMSAVSSPTAEAVEQFPRFGGTRTVLVAGNRPRG